MENLNIVGSYGVPKVNFNASTGVLNMEGRSIPEHPKALFMPLIEWVQEYVKSPCEKTEMNIKVDYMNSSSYKFLITLLEQLEPIHQQNKKITINWYYESDDDEMEDVGEEIKNIIHLPIELIPVVEFD
jgi:hypothetical protein